MRLSRGMPRPHRSLLVHACLLAVGAVSVGLAAGAPAQGASPGWAEGGKPTDARSQVRADERHARATCGRNAALLFRVRGSGEEYGKDRLGHWTGAAGRDLIAAGWHVRDMQALYSAPRVPLSEIADAAFGRTGFDGGLVRIARELKRYRDVARDESPDVMKQLEAAHLRCPQRKIFIAGYSQGGLVLRYVVRGLSGSAWASIASIDLIADPTADMRVDTSLRPDENGHKPHFARQTGRGLDTAANSGNPFFKQKSYPSGLKHRTWQYCAPHDLVCEVHPANLRYRRSQGTIHTSYRWRAIGSSAAARVQAPTSPPSAGGTPVSPPNGAPPSAAAPTAPRTWREQQGSRGVNTFTNPYNASGMGPRIAPYQWVDVFCKIYAPQIASANPDGYWYRMASPPWSGTYYAPANTFWNGDQPGVKPYTHNTDFAVANC